MLTLAAANLAADGSPISASLRTAGGESYTISGGTVVAVLTVSLTAVAAGGGPPRTTRVRLTDVRVKKDGRWVTIYNHSHPLQES